MKDFFNQMKDFFLSLSIFSTIIFTVILLATYFPETLTALLMGVFGTYLFAIIHHEVKEYKNKKNEQ